jgi:hypothetical protein
MFYDFEKMKQLNFIEKAFGNQSLPFKMEIWDFKNNRKIEISMGMKEYPWMCVFMIFLQKILKEN